MCWSSPIAVLVAVVMHLAVDYSCNRLTYTELQCAYITKPGGWALKSSVVPALMSLLRRRQRGPKRIFAHMIILSQPPLYSEGDILIYTCETSGFNLATLIFTLRCTYSEGVVVNYLCRSFLSFSSVLLYLINDKVKLFISLSRKLTCLLTLCLFHQETEYLPIFRF